MSIFAHPLLVRAAPLLSLIVAAWVVSRLVIRDAPTVGLARSAVADLALPATIAGLAMARVAAMLPFWQALIAHPFDVARISGERATIGGAIGGGGALLLLSWRARLPLTRVADLFGGALPIGTAIYGLGCLIRGDCYGRLAPRPFGIVFPGLHTPRYPVELYAAVLGLLVAGGLQAMRPRFVPGGLAFASIGAVAGTRALLDHLRLQQGSLSLYEDQVAAVTICLGAIGGLVWIQWIRPRSARACERHPRPAVHRS